MMWIGYLFINNAIASYKDISTPRIEICLRVISKNVI
jgi:hypothetical protein